LIIADPSAISQLSLFAQKSDGCRFRVALLLGAIIRHSPRLEMLRNLASMPSGDIFHTVVRWLNITSLWREELLPLIPDASPDFQNVNRFYLYSSFFAVMGDCRGFPLFRDALESCRDLCQKIAT
jgi:hypothetical protein